MKVEITGFIHWHKYEWQDEDEAKYVISQCDHSGTGPEYVLIREQKFLVELPDNFDPRPKQVEALRKEKTRILGEAEAKATNIEEQIQRLLALPNKEEV